MAKADGKPPSRAMQKLARTIGRRVDESIGATRINGKAPGGPAKAPPLPARNLGLRMAEGAAVIPLDRIIPDPDQPRKEFDPESIGRLAASLAARGQLQPIRVRWVEAIDRYAIVCGERRWRAAIEAGLAGLVCIVDDRPLGADELLVVQMVENCSREDLAPVEQARAMKALVDSQGWTQGRLAVELGVSQSAVSKGIALLELPQVLMDLVVAGELSPSVARELARVGDPAALRGLVDLALAEHWTLAEAARAARDYSTGIISEADPDPDEAPTLAKKGKKPPRDPSPAGAVPDWRDTAIMALGLPPDLAQLLAKSEIESAGEAWALCHSAFLVGELGWTSDQNVRLSRAMQPFLKAAGEAGPGPGSPIKVGGRGDGEGPGPDDDGDGDPGGRPSAWFDLDVYQEGRPGGSRRVGRLRARDLAHARRLALGIFGDPGPEPGRFTFSPASTLADPEVDAAGGMRAVPIEGEAAPVLLCQLRPVLARRPGEPDRGPAPAPASAWRRTRFAATDELVVSTVGGLEVVLRSSEGERPSAELLVALRDAVARLEGKGVPR